MDRRLTNKLIVVIVIMTVFLIGQLVWLLTKDTLPTITNLTISQKQSKNIITGTKEEYDRVFDSAARFADTPIAKIGGGILPHHLLVKEQIASYLLGLADQKYDTVVIIGPNHQNIGHGDIIYSDANWQTPTGSMDVDLNSANLINSTAKLNNKIIQQESSITVLLPYIHYALPKVKILPLIIKESAKTDELAKIAQLLSQYCQEQKILVLASIDFSHYLPVDVADFHDQITANI
ncbi:MAG: AmmeMemoRadiSam system protein B, partial [Candidatus Komeilibacteria bacterium CG_4_9_14_3_um_filter_37_5]